MSAPVAERSAALSTSPAPATDKLREGRSRPSLIAGFNGNRRVPPPENEPVRSYAPGSTEKASLKARLGIMASQRVEIPVIIGGKEYRTGEVSQVTMPHDHQHVLADWHKATPELVLRAIENSREAQREWGNWPWEERAAVFLRAAELLTTSWRDTVNAATMLGQSKTAYQAEIDAACELIDFWRYNCAFAQELYDEQPVSSHATWNQLDYRPLEGLVYAVTPFNFTAIGGNLPTAPALMGNVVLWKPSSTALLSNYYVYKLLEAAGLPPGVINFVPGNPAMISEIALAHRDLAGVHFTGSTGVFNHMWQTIGSNMSGYRSYPRIVGETGGKDFILAHSSADPQAVAVAIARGGFEYQGQKCSAASRVYVPRSLWNHVRDSTVGMIGDIRMGDVRDFRNFMGAVIDEKSFRRIGEYLGGVRAGGGGGGKAKVLAGGATRGEQGWFVEPTLVETSDANDRLLCEEIFGPVVTAYVYDDVKWEETLQLVDETSPYALTGAVFGTDRAALRQASVALRQAAGNLYLNDKPTGAVVGQQPFGGARASGTNDKAGSKLNLMRWVSARNIKETFAPPGDYGYPFMGEE